MIFRPFGRAARALLALLPMSVIAGGCAFATPWRNVDSGAAAAQPGATAVVALTHARLYPDRRGPFDDATGEVLDLLPRQPGLLGYSVRRELLGDQVWTMTAWRDEASRAAFVASPQHRAAIAKGDKAIRESRFARVTVPASELPLKWERALYILDEQGRNY